MKKRKIVNSKIKLPMLKIKVKKLSILIALIDHIDNVVNFEVVGFEPTHDGFKNHCLTPWLHFFNFRLKFIGMTRLELVTYSLED